MLTFGHLLIVFLQSLKDLAFPLCEESTETGNNTIHQYYFWETAFGGRFRYL